MLCAYVTMLKTITLFVRVSEHTFGFGSKRQFDARRNLFAQERAPFNLFANGLDVDLSAWKESAREGLVFAHQA